MGEDEGDVLARRLLALGAVHRVALQVAPPAFLRPPAAVRIHSAVPSPKSREKSKGVLSLTWLCRGACKWQIDGFDIKIEFFALVVKPKYCSAHTALVQSAQTLAPYLEVCVLTNPTEWSTDELERWK